MYYESKTLFKSLTRLISGLLFFQFNKGDKNMNVKKKKENSQL